MKAQEVIEKTAKVLVDVGVYKDIETAVRSLAIEQIQKKINEYRIIVRDLEKKYGKNFDEFSLYLKGKATAKEEDDWMEWKASLSMIDAYTSCLEKLVKSERTKY